MPVDNRPNIIYLMTDQQKASATSVYGNPYVPCPFMEKMASQGITFNDAYSPSSICTPSRASVFTGVHPLVNQVTCHQNRAPHNLPLMSQMLADNGYYTAVVGHYGYARDLNRGWNQQVYWRLEGPIGRAADIWFSQGTPGIGWDSGTLPCSAQQGHAHAVTDRTTLMLDQICAAGTPFFLHVSYMEPHNPYFTPPPYDKMIDPATLPLPDQGDDTQRPAWQLECMKEQGTAQATEQDIKKVVATYYGMIAYANDQMQRLYQALSERGMLENTWIVFASDHGDYTGEKGLFGKTESLYECLLHVPLIIRPPDCVNAPRGVKLSGLVDLVDIFPTILRIADIDVPEYAQGHDLMTWVNSEDQKPLRDCLFAQVGDYHGHLGKSNYGGTKSGRHPGLLQGARTKEFSYVRDPDYGDEAYDLRKDPKELNNLLGDNSIKEPAEVSELRHRVDQWEQQCIELRNQLGVVPGYRGFDEGWE